MECSKMCKILCVLGVAMWLNSPVLAVQRHVRGSTYREGLGQITVEGDPNGTITPAPPAPLSDAERVLGVVDESGALAERLRVHGVRAADDAFQRRRERRRSLQPNVCGPAGVLLSDARGRSEEHTSELQSQSNLVCRLLLEKKK